jgi:hypothetical protein
MEVLLNFKATYLLGDSLLPSPPAWLTLAVGITLQPAFGRASLGGCVALIAEN